jgi:putative dimethyl sulfoxide reductase chaperone
VSGSEEHAGLAEARSKTWWLLSRFYLERPEVSFLEELHLALGDPASGGVADMDTDMEVVHDALAGDLAGLSDRLLQEYTRLFRGIQDQLGPPPPFESLYRGQGMMGDLTLAVMHRYQAAGFADIEPEAGPQDHLGAELRFLSLLCFREAEAWMAGEDEAARQRIAQQRTFLDEHLLAWLPDYAGRIARESREPFYAAVAKLTLDHAEAVHADLDALEDDLQAA